jgi:NAD(P)-dependent dehydrogenase (short-subunit alcohol dehydrogenase family)
MPNLIDKVAVITGAASGQGLATARLFAAEGARLALLDWNAEGVQAVCRELEASGTDALLEVVDLSQPAAVERSCRAILDRFGSVDVLFNNAGIGYSANEHYRMASVIETPLADWNAIIAINLTSAYLMIRGLAPRMIEQRAGAIINNTSISALVGIRGADAYTATKGALVALTRALAADLGPHGIRVNAIAPGSIATPMIQPLLDEAGIASRLAAIPLGRIGLPDDVAGVALFLASDASRYVTGQIIAVDGGRTAI